MQIVQGFDFLLLEMCNAVSVIMMCIWLCFVFFDFKTATFFRWPILPLQFLGACPVTSDRHGLNILDMSLTWSVRTTTVLYLVLLVADTSQNGTTRPSRFTYHIIVVFLASLLNRRRKYTGTAVLVCMQVTNIHPWYRTEILRVQRMNPHHTSHTCWIGCCIRCWHS